VEHAILDAESRRNAASTSDSEQPRRASPWGTRGLLTALGVPSRPLYRRVGRLVNRSSANKQIDFFGEWVWNFANDVAAKQIDEGVAFVCAEDEARGASRGDKIDNPLPMRERW